MKQNSRFILLLFLGILLLAVLDYVVLEKIYHPISEAYNIPWQSLYASASIPFIWWHVAFVPLGVILFVLFGIAAKSWRLIFSGIILFATGWEDIFYYLIQGNWIPKELPWLNWSPLMNLVRLILGAGNVNNVTLPVTALLGLIVVGLVLYWEEFRKKSLGRRKKRKR